MRLCVNYPVRRGRLVLRTAHDWDRDVLPSQQTDTQAWFDVEVPAPCLELKPAVLDGAEVHWARGPNYVLTPWERDRGLWPYFFDPPHGRVSDVLQVQHDGVTRAVRVYHPPGYDENPLRAFPVLYMQDGKNLFFPEEAFAGNEWRVDETMDRLDQMNAIRKCVVVGISPGDRMRDYTKPGYDAYGRFVVDRLKPLVDANLRTRPQREATVVMGSSLGGVAAMHLGWTWPHVFGRVAALSATFGHFDDLFERIARDEKRDLLVYLDSGWPKDNFEATNAMRDLLVQQGFRLGVDLLQWSFPEGRHGEDSWAARIHLPFQFFFGRAWLAQRGDV
ncbi:MAG: alpha/beta hydrolase-fold protein [Myxococcaceae bacterium]|nr:alpha/beta hydrolase-fold protein [Myxococcaceae bacterium]